MVEQDAPEATARKPGTITGDATIGMAVRIERKHASRLGFRSGSSYVQVQWSLRRPNLPHAV